MPGGRHLAAPWTRPPLTGHLSATTSQPNLEAALWDARPTPGRLQVMSQLREALRGRE